MAYSKSSNAKQFGDAQPPGSALSVYNSYSDLSEQQNAVEPTSDVCYSSCESEITMHIGTSTSRMGETGINGDLMKYKTHYPKLLESFQSLEKDHQQLMKLIISKQIPCNFKKKSIEEYLNSSFALRVADKKEKFDRQSTTEAIDEGNFLFTAKRWKRRYYNLIDAIDLLYRDYKLINYVMDNEPEKIYSERYRNQLESRLNELQSIRESHQGIYEESDMSITVSNAFVADLISQCRIYRSELEKQLSIKERLFYVLKKAKEQRSKLKVFVNTLRDELRFVMYKIKDNQSTIAAQYNASTFNENNIPYVSAANDSKDIIQLHDKIQELERILKEEEARRKKLHNKLQEIIGNIRVYCRIKPHNECVLKVDSDDKILLMADVMPEKIAKTWGTPMKLFIFDKVFGPEANQTDVFDSLCELITSCVDGFNVCIMAYGQTGSGKTHTMMGPPTDPGVNRRSIKELLRVCNERKQWSYQLCLSMVEIYNEDVRDLLTPGTMPDNSNVELNSVKIMSTQDDDIVIQGLSEHQVNSEKDIITFLELGEKNRTVGSTQMNIHSSRSHLILLLKVNGENNVHKTSSRGTLTLCDLAGSENISKSGATGGRFQEATSINKSLTSLGRVFDSLRKRQKPPYRDTKLTFFLKPTLGGDSKCLLLVNVRSELENVEESLRALFFGQNAMQVAPEQKKQQKVSVSSIINSSTNKKC